MIIVISTEVSLSITEFSIIERIHEPTFHVSFYDTNDNKIIVELKLKLSRRSAIINVATVFVAELAE